MNIDLPDTEPDESPAIPDDLYVPRLGLKPFKQGDCDALCGLYAIINAIRWAAWPKLITHKEAKALFGVLIDHAIKERGMMNLCWYGTTSSQLKQLIRCAITYVQDAHDLPFASEAISSKAFVLVPGASTPILASPSARLGEAYILEIKHTAGHWTVFEGLEGSKVRFFDSSGMRTAQISRIRFRRAFRVALTTDAFAESE